MVFFADASTICTDIKKDAWNSFIFAKSLFDDMQLCIIQLRNSPIDVLP